MTSEQRYFLQLISDYIGGRASAAPQEDVKLETLAQIAAKQSLGGIIYVQSKEFLPRGSEAFFGLERFFTASIFRYVNYAEAGRELKHEFTDAGIEMLMFKGLDTAKYHPIRELRTMGDLDMLIHREDRKAAHRLMLSLGFECSGTGDSVWTYRRDAAKIEIHDRMIYEKLSTDFDYAGYFDGAWDYADDGELSPNMQFLFLLAHTAKHILNCGSGFRPFLDMVFLAKSDNLDWEFVTAELEKIQLLEFCKVCFALCERWFGVELPLEAAKLSEEFFAQATEKAFFDGLFGLENSENVGANIAKDMKRKGKISWKTSIAIAWRKLFPKENSMSHLKLYSFLFRHKALRPIAWAYRIVYCTVTKFPHSIKMLVYPFTKRKEIENRHSFAESWGL